MDITDEDEGPVGDYGVDKDYDAWYYLDLLKESGKGPFSVCQTDIGSNAIFCDGCCAGYTRNTVAFRTSLFNDPDFRCA